MKTFRILLFIIFSSVLQGVYAQPEGEWTTRSSRARRAFELALDSYRLMNNALAKEALHDAIKYDNDFIEAYILLGEVYHAEGDYPLSIQAYERALNIDPDFFPAAWFFIGEAYILSGQYEEASQRFERYLIYPRIGESLKQKAIAHLETTAFAIGAIKNPVPFDPQNLGETVNGPFAEYSPALTTDEQTLIFTRKQPRDDPAMMVHGRDFENFYVSHWQDGSWGKAIDLGPPINTPGNEGAQSISADGRHLFFTACNRPEGIGSCDIYYAEKQGDQWTQPVNLGEVVNSFSWDSQPSVSADGNTLYFASSRKGSAGKMDIWVTTRNPQGQWEPPRNIGPEINTGGSDMSPFIHHDNRTLYFSSDGHPGMGGLDLFYSRRQEDGSWGKPVNMGYPINSHAEEFSLIVNASGTEAYFSSDQYGGFGEMDLYMFELHESARPEPVTFMRGIVFDSDTDQPLEAAFELLEVASGETIINSFSDSVSGEFLVAIPTGRDLALHVSRPGYLFFSEYFSYDARSDMKPYLHDIPLTPFRKGETVIMRNIFFDHDSYELKTESRSELQRLARLLEENPGMEIQINGHTDSTGSPEYNQELSENRARSVYQYLTEQNIDSGRLSYKGFGDTRPVDTNETEEGRANNRRTEFEIVELNQP